MISVTLYTLIVFSFDHVRPALGLLSPACHRATLPGRRCRQVIVESADPGGLRLRLHRPPRWYDWALIGYLNCGMRASLPHSLLR